VSLNRTVSAAAVRGLSVIHKRASTTQSDPALWSHATFVAFSPANVPSCSSSCYFIQTEKESVRENMRLPDPTLPSITSVLSKAQPALTTRGSTRRRGKFGVRRSKSSPSFGAPDGPHPPRYPPQLNSDFLEVREPLSITVLPPVLIEESHRSIVDARKTVDYRFSNSLPRAPSRSSFALVCKIFH
jgi:hypothetical protein